MIFLDPTNTKPRELPVAMNKNQGTPSDNEQKSGNSRCGNENKVASYLHVFDSSTNSSPGPRQRGASWQPQLGKSQLHLQLRLILLIVTVLVCLFVTDTFPLFA